MGHAGRTLASTDGAAAGGISPANIGLHRGTRTCVRRCGAARRVATTSPTLGRNLAKPVLLHGYPGRAAANGADMDDLRKAVIGARLQQWPISSWLEQTLVVGWSRSLRLSVGADIGFRVEQAL